MHRPLRIALSVSVTFALAAMAAGACGGSSADTGTCDAADPSCTTSGVDGGGDSPGGGVRPPIGGGAGCKTVGTACAASTECCDLVCDAGKCGAGACIADNDACTTVSSCCSGACNAGKCTPLSTTCKTSGNPCTTSDQCCSKLCVSGVCSQTSSYCVQQGDVCAKATDCCSGLCSVASGATLGTCGAPPTGPTDCKGVDGTVCNGCTDCCSRTCAPYAATGVNICTPAEGCHVTGDLCTKDSDCCGSAGTGLPGDGHVTCDFSSGIPGLGICRNPLSCNPEGNVCHFKDYVCGSSSARADCCGALGAKGGECKLDPLGVPRCYGISACKKTGETCASSADCCDGTPCVPDPTGVLKCGAAPCSPSTGACTTDADCCSGLTCTHPLGSTSGTCGSAPPPPPPPDGGTYDAPPTDGGVYTCSLYGQSCKADGDCCNGITCLDAANAPCSATPVGSCTCHTAIK